MSETELTGPLEAQAANDRIRELLEGDAPFIAGKMGDGEANGLWIAMVQRRNGMVTGFPDDVRRALTVNAGV